MEYENIKKFKINENWNIGDNQYKCPLCDKVYPKKGIISHLMRTHYGVKFGSGYNGKYNDPEFKEKIRKNNIKRCIEKYGKYKKYLVKCSGCSKHFYITEREKLFPLKEHYYCNRSCANKHIITSETKEKIRNGVIKNLIENGIKRDYKRKEYKCIICGNDLGIKRRKYCNECLKKKRQENMSEIKKYRSDCQFNFNLSDYPDEFDFELIRRYGWYSASNHGNNLSGVSRDHSVSINYGFKNNIPIEIIRHPANCRLIQHNENSKKHIKCSMTINELYNKIDNWNKKYNASVAA
jgi:hypothetical protein